MEFFFCYGVVGILYVLWILTQDIWFILSDGWFANILSHSVGCLFTLWAVSFAMQKL